MSVPTRRIITPSGEDTGENAARASRVVVVNSEGKIIYDLADIGDVFGEMLLELKRIRTIGELSLGKEVGVEDINDMED